MPVIKQLALSLALLGAASTAQGQAFIDVPIKLRDFSEMVNGSGISAATHPDFNNDSYLQCGTFNGQPVTGYVNSAIATNGQTDPAFSGDNRTPVLLRTTNPRNPSQSCYTSQERFNQWFNDVQGVNRPFRSSIRLDAIGNGLYQFNNQKFFPLDNGASNLTPVFPAPDNVPYGHLNSGSNSAHNYGFTMEFHSTFTYQRNSGQVFTFSGDDDVWVFIDGRLVIDLGGVHARLDQTVSLDDVLGADGQPLVSGESYDLDFYFAERHTVESNCIITTSLKLAPPKVATPRASPAGRAFLTQLSVTLETTTPQAVIWYTTDGSIPDSTSANTRRYVPGTPVSIIATTKLQAIAYRPGWEKSDVMNEQYTKPPTASSLEILDVNGNPLPGGYLTELNTAYTVRITTTQAGVPTLSPAAVTLTLRDSASLSLSNPAFANERFIFSGTVPFAIAGAKVANAQTEAAVYDNLQVRWVNPRDPNDTASKTVAVRPAPKQATAYFSSKLDGSDNLTQYTGNEDTLYVIVVDQVLPAGSNPRITLVTAPAVLGSAVDRDTLPLQAIPGKPGSYVAVIPVDKAGATVPGNGRLRLANADQITATYQDPVDTEAPAVANAGYGAPAVLTATLKFTHADGTPVTAGSFYSPQEGKLYLTYTDDWLDGTLPNKTATLTIQNRGNAPSDNEVMVMTLVPAEVKGTRGVWKGSINLKDGLSITPSNGTVETYILGQVTATVTSHNPDGSAGPAVTDNIQVAYGDEIARIGIVDAKDSTLPIGRTNDNLIVKLNEQSLSSGTDTLTVRLRCSVSGDEVLVKVIEVSPGVYVSQSIPKGEGPAANDGALTCRESDVIKATYTDPVHNTQGELSLTILSPVTTAITYTTAAEPFTPITAVEENKATSFRVVVDAFGKNTKAVDVITVQFTTLQGERDSVLAVETDVHSQKFVGVMPIAFTIDEPQKHNGRLEGKLGTLGVDNHVIATGTVNLDGVETSKPITLVAAFVQGNPAYIKDANLDGRADQVFIQFPRKLGRLPATVEAQWNTESADFKSVSGEKISFHNGDSTLVVADFSADPWPLHVTSIPQGQDPKVRLPKNDGLFLGQTISLKDSIGPMIVSAIKIPAEVNEKDPSSTGYNHDTLEIRLSEPIRSGSTTGLTDMLRYSQKGCGDYEGSVAVIAVTEPNYDPVTQTYRVVVDHSSSTVPLKGDCIFLNGHPNKVEDLADNLPARVGVTLEGNDRKKLIQLFRGYPPVAGLDPNSPKRYYQVATQDPMDGKTGYVNDDGDLNWIPPKGFNSSAKDFQSYLPRKVEDQATGETETKTFESFPTAWSALQVVSTSRYLAKVSIFDNLGNFVRSFDYSFGYQGELSNSDRRYRGAFVSWIPWNQRDRKGQRVGQGVYVWKVVFTFEKGKQEIMYTRTGITGQAP